MPFIMLIGGLIVGLCLGWIFGSGVANARARRAGAIHEADLLEREERLLRARAERLGLTISEAVDDIPPAAEPAKPARPVTTTASMDKLFCGF